MSAHGLITGITNAGKTVGTIVDRDALIMEGIYRTIFLDPKREAAESLMARDLAMGRDTFYHSFAPKDHRFPGINFQWSTNPDEFHRAVENKWKRQGLKELVQSNIGMTSMRGMGFTVDWIDAAFDLHANQLSPKPLSFLAYAMDYGSPQFDQMLRDCTEPDTIRKFRDMQARWRKRPQPVEDEIGSAKRKLRVFKDLVLVRHLEAPPFDYIGALNAGRHLIFDGGGLDKETRRLMILFTAITIINSLKEYFERYGKTIPTIFYFDETGANDLLTEFFIECGQTLRSAKVFLRFITQSSDDFTTGENLFSRWAANSGIIHAYKTVSPSATEMMAKILSNPTFDDKEVHTSRTVMQHTGRYEKVQTHSDNHNATKQMKGGLITGKTGSDGRTTSESFRALYEPQVIETFVNPQLHDAKFRAELSNLRIGQRFVRDFDGVRKETVTMLEQPWELGQELISVKGLPLEELFPEGEATLKEYNLKTGIHLSRLSLPTSISPSTSCTPTPSPRVSPADDL